MPARILILGGGFAGMFAAKELWRKFGASAKIELINDENFFVFQPLLPEVGAGSITAVHAVTPLRFLLKGIFVRKARVESVDTVRKVVTIFQGVQRRPTEVPYDHLVVALGQTVDLSRTPGLADHAITMKTLSDARRLRAHVIERLEHAEITGLPEVKREALTFVVVGGGFSGIETVGEMKELIDRSLKYYPNIRPEEVRVIVPMLLFYDERRDLTGFVRIVMPRIQPDGRSVDALPQQPLALQIVQRLLAKPELARELRGRWQIERVRYADLPGERLFPDDKRGKRRQQAWPAIRLTFGRTVEGPGSGSVLTLVFEPGKKQSLPLLCVGGGGPLADGIREQAQAPPCALDERQIGELMAERSPPR